MHVEMCLKEDLAWAADKQPWIFSNIMAIDTDQSEALTVAKMPDLSMYIGLK